MISSYLTVWPGEGSRSSGEASTAQAAEAHEARMARFSASVMSESPTTCAGLANALAGCKNWSSVNSFLVPSVIATCSAVEGHGYECGGFAAAGEIGSGFLTVKRGAPPAALILH